MGNSLLFDLERDIARLLLDRLKHLNISVERSAQIARFILLSLPNGITEQDVRKKLPMLDDKFNEIAGIISKYLEQEEKKSKTYTIETVHTLLENGKLEEASQLLHSYFNK